MLQDFKPLLQDLILLLVLSNNPGEQQLSLPELLKLAELLMQDRREIGPSVQNSIRSSMWISIRSRFKQLLNPGRYFIKVQGMFLCRGQWNVSRPDNFLKYLFHILNYSCFFRFFKSPRKCDKKALLIATNLSNLTSICCVYKEKIVKNDPHRRTQRPYKFGKIQ